MASWMMITFRPAVIGGSAGSAGDQRRRRGGASGGGAWWSPLFGWGAEPDYIDSGEPSATETAEAANQVDKMRRSKYRRYTAFTEEKAKVLRMRMMEAESFHDPMYHSAIASRLASDVRRQSVSDH